MLNWNTSLFALINAGAHPAPWLVRFAVIAAQSPLIVVPAVLVILWIRGRPASRGNLLAVTLAVLIGLGINQLLGMLWFEPRPFMAGIGHTYMQHAPDNSFPSDHATFVWTLGFGLILTRAAIRWGIGVSLYGLLVAWARIFLGVHFPVDMLAPLPVALIAAATTRTLRPAVARFLLPPCNQIYEWALVTLHLPAKWFPRS